MKKIRNNTFETNSSSTHSLTICTKEDYKKWENGELYYYDERLVSKEEAGNIIRENIICRKIDTNWKEKFMTFKGEKIIFDNNSDWREKRQTFYTPENLNEITQEEIDKYMEESDNFQSKEDFFNDYELESYKQNYITPNGEEIVAFGKFGSDY